MRRSSIIALLVGGSLVVLIFWIASNTYWAEVKLPMPPQGEARINPFYAVQRFAEALGARTRWDRVFTTPPADSVIVVSAWHWGLSTGRREALERWVESGGRLVVDRTLVGGEEEFARWSGILRASLKVGDDPSDAESGHDEACSTFQQEGDGMPSGVPETTHYSLCNFDRESSLTTDRKAAWALRDGSGIQAMRVRVGRGSVTVINATPFRYRNVFDGDHGWLFAAATELRREDDVHFLSEDDHPSLLALLWQHGRPVVVLTLALIALVLWRGGARFGPVAAPQHAARRSLAEQIRGTGQFALRHGSGDALHAASVRALDEAAQRRVPSYARLSAKERAAALARLTGFDRDALAAAVHHPRSRRSHALRSTVALLEAARRRTLVVHTRLSHAKD